MHQSTSHITYLTDASAAIGAVESAIDSVGERHRMTDVSAVLEAVANDAVDAVVIELESVDIDAIEALIEIRAVDAEVPVILTSREPEGHTAASAIEHGVTEYLPVGPIDSPSTVVATRLQAAVDRYRRARRTSDLERIREVLHAVNEALVTAESTGEVDERVCEIIANAEPYSLAWIGSHDEDDAVVVPRAWAGSETAYLADLEITTDDEPTAMGPTGRALATREIAVSQDLETDPDYEPWREAALEHGFRSSAAIPLVHDGTDHGVLNVYADRSNAFDTDERELLEVLGDTVGYALHDLAAREELDRTSTAVEEAADAIFITDADGTIEYVNPAFEALTGFDADDAVGQTPRILNSGEHDQAYYDRMWSSILEGAVWEEEIINERRSGEQYVAEQTIAPLTAANGKIDGFVAIQRDITERRRHERELARSRDRLRVLFDDAPDSIIVHDIEGNVLDVNARMVERLGYDREELLEMHVTDFEVGIDEETLLSRWADLDAGTLEKVEVDGRHRRRDGSTFPVEVWVSRSTDATGEDRFMAIARDITARKRREAALSERQAHLRQAQAIATMGSWQLDLVTDELEWSDEVFRIYETTRRPEGYEWYLEFVHPDDRDAVDDRWASAKETGEFDFEHRIITDEGATRWVHVRAEFEYEDGEPRAAIGVVREITDEKERERELELFKRAVEEAGHAVVITDDAGTIEYANPAFAHQSGYAVDTAVGATPRILRSAEHEPSFYRDIWETITDGEVWEGEAIQQRRNGALYHVHQVISPIRDGAGGVTHFVTVQADITRRHLRQQRLAVLTRILRHNVRNAMNVVDGYAAEIVAQTDDGDIAADAMAIARAAERLLELSEQSIHIQDLLDEPSPTGAETELGPLLAELRRQLVADRPHAEVRVDVPEGTTVATDDRIGAAIREAMYNAVDHSDRSTPTVEVTVNAPDTGGSTDRIVIEIADDGPGIPATERAAIDRGEESPLVHGEAIGLWLIQWVTRFFGGSIAIETNEPRGTVVRLELPTGTAAVPLRTEATD